NFKGYEKDLFSAFIIRNLQLTREFGELGFMTPFVWMFISSYEELRTKLIDDEIISSLVQLEYSGFDGATVPICTFTLTKGHIRNYTGSYIRLSNFKGSTNQGPKTLEAINNRDCGWLFDTKPDDFKKIPGSPIAYDMPTPLINCFQENGYLADVLNAKSGQNTGDNARFIRNWSEIDYSKIGYNTKSLEDTLSNGFKWYPYNKGGEFRKWYGNFDSVINWENDGQEIKEYAVKRNGGKHWSRYIQNLDYMLKEGITWTFISSSYFGA
ncbi:hypothetical protein P3672_25775, partial [Vibrio parahaemolyticus]|nr:hypothetical protein [Vibrio parahaemolyticus]